MIEEWSCSLIAPRSRSPRCSSRACSAPRSSLEETRRKAAKKAQEALLDAAKEGDVARARALLQEGTDVNTRDGNQRTALLHAARGGHLALLRTLVEARPDLDAWDVKGRTPLMEAARRDEAMPASVLVAAGADVNLVDEDGWTALMHAAKEGTLAAARSIIRAPRQASLDARAKDGRGALSLAAERGRTALVRVLLDAGADARKPEIGGRALQIAAEKGHANVVALLMEARAPLGFSAWDNELPLQAAAARGQRAIVDALLEAGTDPDLADKAGQTALVKAAAGGHDEVVASLLRLGASPDLPDREGWTPLMHAAAHASSGSVGSIRALVRAGAQVEPADRPGRHHGADRLRPEGQCARDRRAAARRRPGRRAVGGQDRPRLRPRRRQQALRGAAGLQGDPRPALRRTGFVDPAVQELPRMQLRGPARPPKHDPGSAREGARELPATRLDTVLEARRHVVYGMLSHPQRLAAALTQLRGHFPARRLPGRRGRQHPDQIPRRTAQHESARHEPAVPAVAHAILHRPRQPRLSRRIAGAALSRADVASAMPIRPLGCHTLSGGVRATEVNRATSERNAALATGLTT